ncbi:MAG: TonB-dependent receptor plug domain-containing protein, partial [Flavobacteriaceae bacterium]|nr:TonB-dependent receptor plug domain-containing protein [Flavobacteriaceae bacterium]
ISDEKGYFKLDRVNKDDIISIRHIGYKIVTEYAEKLNTKQCETFFLEPKVEDLSEIILTNYLTNGINKVIDGSISINYKNFGTVPGLIETDVLQTLQAIPGFQSVSETVSHLNIRGGTHDQNLILWDGIKIYQSGHFFGLISTMNPRMTRRVSLYKNGTPANYTDGVSGTVDMKTDYEVNRQLKAELGMNFINMDAFVDVPIRKNSSLQLASRTSISDYFNTPTYLEYFDRVFQNTDVLASSNNSNTTNQKFDFHDFSLRWIYDFTEKDKLRVNFLHLSNAIVISENAFGGSLYSTRESSLKQRNWSGGLNYSRIWNSKLKTDAQFYANKYQLEAKNFDILNEQILIQGNEILETGFYVNSKYTLNDQLSFEGGYQLTESGISNSNKLNAPPVDEYEKDVIDEHGLFVSSTLASKSQNTYLTVGLRSNFISPLKKMILEPRMSLNHRLNDKFSLQLLGEFKHQVTTLITDSRDNFLGIEKRRWELSNNDDIPVIKSKQISLGGNYSHQGLMINAEVYAKKVNGINALSQNFQNQYEFVSATGNYFVKGLDFIINNKFDDVSAWLSYSYAHNNYTFSDFSEKTFPSNLDIRHTFALGTSYTLDNLKLSAGFHWRTGKPATEPLETNPTDGIHIFYRDANSSNLDAYHRLDASAIYDFNFSDRIKVEAGVSILNVLNTKNILNKYYYLDQNNEVKEANEYALRFTPNVALRVFF